VDNSNNDNSNNNKKKLQRSRVDSVFAGVCGGLGEYFNIESRNIRWAFAIFTVLGGSGILLYIILAILMD